jgi:hypothetical protein
MRQQEVKLVMPAMESHIYMSKVQWFFSLSKFIRKLFLEYIEEDGINFIAADR